MVKGSVYGGHTLSKETPTVAILAIDSPGDHR